MAAKRDKVNMQRPGKLRAVWENVKLSNGQGKLKIISLQSEEIIELCRASEHPSVHQAKGQDAGIPNYCKS